MSKVKHGKEPSGELIGIDHGSDEASVADVNDAPSLAKQTTTNGPGSWTPSAIEYAVVAPRDGKYTHKSCGASVIMQPAMAREFVEGKAFYKSLSCPGCGCARPISEFTIE